VLSPSLTSAAGGMLQDVQARQSLAVQLQALSEWEHYMFGRLKVFKVRDQLSIHLKITSEDAACLS